MSETMQWCYLVFALALVVGGEAYGKDGVTQTGETGKRIVAFVQDAHQNAGFTGAVLAGSEGKVIAAVAVGQRDPQSTESLKVDTLFELASCTKPFTAIAVMKLVEEGRLSLDDPIAKYLPGIPESCEAITVRHLLQHTSGIPGTNSHGSGDRLADVLPTFLEGGPRTPPGTRHEYWNQGYALLSEVIAKASGKPYTSYVRDKIFAPCKMESSRFTGQRPPRGTSVAVGTSSRGADRSALDHPYGEYGLQYRGMGGLVTNLIDLWRWDRTLARGQLLNAESIAAMTDPGEAGYALGWRIRRLSSGATVHEHTGSVRGFLASLRRNPSDDGCLFVLSNSDSTAPFDLVRTGCENLLEGKSPPLIPKASQDYQIEESILDELAGTYRDDKGRTLTVRREGPNAQASIDWHGPITHGYLGAGEDDELLFGTMRAYDRAGFASADRIVVERTDKGVDALVLKIVASDASIRFVRLKD